MIKVQMLPLKWCTTRKSEWVERFSETRLPLPHMNAVLAKMWGGYKIDAEIIIFNILKKNHLLPLKPPENMKAYGGSWLYEIQAVSEETSQCINTIYKKTSEHTQIESTITSKNVSILYKRGKLKSHHNNSFIRGG